MVPQWCNAVGSFLFAPDIDMTDVWPAPHALQAERHRKEEEEKAAAQDEIRLQTSHSKLQNSIDFMVFHLNG